MLDWLFRPQCAACMECVSLRLAVEEFEPTKSQRRAWRKLHMCKRCGQLVA